MSETINMWTEDMNLTKAQFILESAMNEYTLSLMKIEKELEMKHFIFESTYDDQDEIDRLYMEAEEKAKKDKENILQKILRTIGEFFQGIINMITGKKKTIDKNTLYTNDTMTEAELNKAVEIYEQQEILFRKSQQALDKNDVKQAKRYFDEAVALSEDPENKTFLEKASKPFRAIGKQGKKLAIAGGVVISGHLLIKKLKKMEHVSSAWHKLTTTIAKANAAGDDLSKENIKDKDDLLAMQTASTGFMKTMTNRFNSFRIAIQPDDKKVAFAASLTDKQVKKAQRQKQIENTYAASVKTQSDIATGRLQDGTEAIESWPDKTLTLDEFLKKYFNGAMPNDRNALASKYPNWKFPDFKDGDNYKSALIHPGKSYKSKLFGTVSTGRVLKAMKKDLDRRIAAVSMYTGKETTDISDYIILFDVWGLFSGDEIDANKNSPYARYCTLQEELYTYYKNKNPHDKRSIMTLWKEAFTGKYRDNVAKYFSIENGTTQDINERVYREWMYYYTKAEYIAALGKGKTIAKNMSIYFGSTGAGVPSWVFRDSTNAELKIMLNDKGAYKGGVESIDPKTGKKSVNYDFAIKQLFKDQPAHEKYTFNNLGEGGNLYRWKKAEWEALSPGGVSTIKSVIGNKNPVIVDCDDRDIPTLRIT